MKHLLPWLLLLVPAALGAQTPDSLGGWDTPQVMALVREAQARRAETAVDTGLTSYQADARGYVYFFLERGRGAEAERTLVKTDQVALEVFWKAPGLTKQRIVGWRDEKTLPTNINYHKDHLTVVQDNFGDRIRLGDGDEVQDVLHPVAPDAEAFYHYRLSDSLTITLPGVAEPVRVFEIRVRPRDLSQPAFLGSIYVDRARGSLVRMDFTFTPSSYRDRYLDYINVSLDNGLWKGRFWLPNRQRVEIRRALPELDFPAGGVIRGTMRVGGYRFNEPFPDGLFAGPRVVAVGPAERERFPFREGIHEEVREEGISPDVDLEAIRREATALARRRVLSGIPANRLNIPRTSEALRYNRAEGLFLGLGYAVRPSENLSLGVRGGWAFGAEHPVLSASATADAGATRWTGSAYLNVPHNVGGVGPAASGLVNSFTALLAGNDYTDLYYGRGAAAEVRHPLGPRRTLGAELRAEEQRSAGRDSDFSLFGDFRPVHPIDDGTALRAHLEAEQEIPAEAGAGWGMQITADAGTLHADADSLGTLNWVRPQGEIRRVRRWRSRDTELDARLSGGFAAGTLPRQELFLLGGRGTLPGFAFRSFGGDRYLLGRAVLSAALSPPMLRGRLLGALGTSGVGEPSDGAAERWGIRGSGTPRGSVGVGVGIFYDILRLDLAHGIGPGARWELIVDTRRAFWGFL